MPTTRRCEPRRERRPSRTGVALREGVYIMLSGPSYETRAELRMLRAWAATRSA